MKLTISKYMKLTSLVLLIAIYPWFTSSSAVRRIKSSHGRTGATIQLHAEDGYPTEGGLVEETTTNIPTTEVAQDIGPTDSTDLNLNFDYSNTNVNVASQNGGANSQQVDGQLSSSSVETTTNQGNGGVSNSSVAGTRQTTFPSTTTNIKLGARHFGNRVVQSASGLNNSESSSISNTNYSTFNSNSIHPFDSNPRQSQSVIATQTLNSSSSSYNSTVNSTNSKYKRRKYNITPLSSSTTSSAQFPTMTSFAEAAEFSERIGLIDLGGLSSETSATTNPTEYPTTTMSSHYSISPLIRRKQILLNNGIRLPRPTKYIVNADTYSNTQLPFTTFAASFEETTTTTEATQTEPSNHLSQISLTGRRVKIRLQNTTALPSQRPSEEPTNHEAAQSEIHRKEYREHGLPHPSPAVPPPPSPSPTFEFNPSVTVQDGVYSYKYSVPEYSSRRVQSQEFGVTQHSYDDGDDNHDNENDDDAGGEENEEHDTTVDNSFREDDDINTTTPHLLPTTSFEPHYYPEVKVQEYEDDNHRSVYGQLTPVPPAEEQGRNEELILNHVKRNNIPAGAVTVTVTVTTMANASDSHKQHQQGTTHERLHHHNHHIGGTPALPSPTPSSIHHYEHDNDRHHQHGEHSRNDHGHGHSNHDHSDDISDSPDETTTESQQDQENAGPNQNHHQDQLEISPSPTMTVDAENEPVTNSKDFKSVYYSSTENPYFKSSSYSYSSSQVYSFHDPHSNEHDEDDQHSGGSEADGDHHSPLQDHNNDNNASNHEHQHSGSSHNHQSIEEDIVHKQQQQIIPTTSTLSYWDTLGLKSAEVSTEFNNQRNVTSAEALPRPSPIPVPEGSPSFRLPTSQHPKISFSVPSSPSSPTSFSTSSTSDLESDYSTPSFNVNQNPFATLGTPTPSDYPHSSPVPMTPHLGQHPTTAFTKSVVTTFATTTSSGITRVTKKQGQPGNKATTVVSEENEVEVVTDDIIKEDSNGKHDNPQQPHPSAVDSSEQIREGEESIKSGPNNIPMLLPVPVFVKIALKDISPSAFCQNVEQFKEMIAKIYEKNQRSVTPAQIVVHNIPSCISNETSTTSTTVRTSSSPQVSSAVTGSTRGPYTTKRMKVYNGESSEEDHGRKRKRRSPIDTVEDAGKTSQEKFSSTQTRLSSIESGVSLPPTTIPRARKRKSPPPFYVYIYVTDKNGTYDQTLTEAFVTIWNITGNEEAGSASGEEIGSGIIVGNMFNHKIKTVEMIASTTQSVMEQDLTSSENYGVIIAIAVASIIAVCLLLVGIFLLVMRHRQSKTKFAKRCTPVTLDDYSLDNISVFNSFRRKQRGRASKRSYTNAGFEDPNAPSRPLNAAGLLNAVTTESAQLSEEFSNIPNVNPTLEDIPGGAETKNRYANVIPVPDSRVLLTFQDEQQNSDYINANYVRGASGTSKAYIITQGPLDETIIDFWRMIWEQQVRVILMVTDLSESGIAKCAAYYPRSETIDSSQLHGDFQVTLEKRDITENCIISYLVLKDMERSLRRDVVHCWYHTWPEKGVPSKPNNTIDFLMRTRKFTKESYPIVVHCSPGTGRSGALVACDIGMKELDNQRQIDIPQIVKKIRQDRAGSVQTKEQYKHIYEVLNSYATKITNNASSTDNSRADP